jgi:hypothetical protein
MPTGRDNPWYAIVKIKILVADWALWLEAERSEVIHYCLRISVNVYIVRTYNIMIGKVNKKDCMEFGVKGRFTI